MKTAYADRRRTQIVALKDGEEMKNLLTTTDVMPSQGVWVSVTADGLIGRTSGEDLPKWTSRNAPRHLYATTTHQTLYLAASDGRAAAISVQSLPEIETFADGIPLYKASPFEDGQTLVKIFAAPVRLEEGEEHFVVTVSRNGLVKKSSIGDLPGPSTQLFWLAKVNAGDEIGWVELTDGKSELLLATRNGMVIRFTEEDVRPMGLVAAGVNGIKLAAGDIVIGAARVIPPSELLLVGVDGKAWRLPNAQLPVQGRYGQGAIACRPQAGGELAGMVYSHPDQDFILQFTDGASKILSVNAIPAGRRQSTGKLVTTIKAGEKVAWLAEIEDGLAYWEKREGKKVKRPRREPEPEVKVDQLALPLGEKPARQSKSAEPKKAAPVKEKPGTRAGKTTKPTVKKAVTKKLGQAKVAQPKTTARKTAAEKPAAIKSTTSKTPTGTKNACGEGQGGKNCRAEDDREKEDGCSAKPWIGESQAEGGGKTQDGGKAGRKGAGETNGKISRGHCIKNSSQCPVRHQQENNDQSGS